MMNIENYGEQTRAHNHLLQICTYCKKEFQLSEGDIIYGKKWYHKDCFNGASNK